MLVRSRLRDLAPSLRHICRSEGAGASDRCGAAWRLLLAVAAGEATGSKQSALWRECGDAGAHDAGSAGRPGGEGYCAMLVVAK